MTSTSLGTQTPGLPQSLLAPTRDNGEQGRHFGVQAQHMPVEEEAEALRKSSFQGSTHSRPRRRMISPKACFLIVPPYLWCSDAGNGGHDNRIDQCIEGLAGCFQIGRRCAVERRTEAAPDPASCLHAVIEIDRLPRNHCGCQATYFAFVGAPLLQ